MKYNTILKCKLVAKNIMPQSLQNYQSFDNQYILTYDGCPLDLEVDLLGDFDFNTEYDKVNTEKVATIDNIEQLKAFCKNNDIRVPMSCTHQNGICVGGCKDRLINNDMIDMGWLE